MGYPTDEEFRVGRACSTPRERREKLESDYDNILADVGKELKRAADLGFGLFNSAHEGFAIINEEFDELKAHVWTKQSKRDLKAMRKEAIEVAAMAVKFVESMDAGAGRV